MSDPNFMDLSTVTDIPNKVLFDAWNRLQSVAQLQNKIVRSFDADETIDRLRSSNNAPGAGIVYEGMRPMPENSPAAKLGASAELIFSIILMNTGRSIVAQADTKTPTIALLAQVRAAFFGQRSPSGGFYRFMVEAPAVEKDNVVVWVQRWATPVSIAVGPVTP